MANHIIIIRSLYTLKYFVQIEFVNLKKTNIMLKMARESFKIIPFKKKIEFVGNNSLIVDFKCVVALKVSVTFLIKFSTVS